MKHRILFYLSNIVIKNLSNIYKVEFDIIQIKIKQYICVQKIFHTINLETSFDLFKKL